MMPSTNHHVVCVVGSSQLVGSLSETSRGTGGWGSTSKLSSGKSVEECGKENSATQPE